MGINGYHGALTALRVQTTMRLGSTRAQEVAMLDSESWVTIEVVAEHLAVSKDTIRRWIDRRDLPAHRAGRFWRLKLSEVDQWVRASGDHGDEYEREDA